MLSPPAVSHHLAGVVPPYDGALEDVPGTAGFVASPEISVLGDQCQEAPKCALTRLLHEEGVPLTAGTDANNPWIIPGLSFHRELELLVEAGLPPLDVLDIATRGNARHVGVLEDRGTIEAGKRADLVLLRSDPRDHISATRDIEWVMQGGTLRYPEKQRCSAGSWNPHTKKVIGWKHWNSG